MPQNSNIITKMSVKMTPDRSEGYHAIPAHRPDLCRNYMYEGTIFFKIDVPKILQTCTCI